MAGLISGNLRPPGSELSVSAAPLSGLVPETADELATGRRPRYFVSIQYLRAIAALMLVVYHARGPMARLGYAGLWPRGLSFGVDIFFVISGFVMWHSTFGRSMPVLEFYRRRILRIVPLYWAMTAVVMLALMLAPALVHSGHFSAGHILRSFLFLPAVHPFTGLIEPVLIPGWTLNEEMYFYALFGVCLLLPVWVRVPALWALLMVPVVLLHALPHPGIAMQFYGNPRVLGFALGAALGAVDVDCLGWTARSAIGASVVGMFLMTVTLRELPRELLITGAALAVVAGMLLLEHSGRLAVLPLLALLGDASYSVYLCHTIVLSALEQVARYCHPFAFSPPGAAACMLLLMAGAVTGGVLVYRWVEQPLGRLFGTVPAMRRERVA